MSGNIHVAREIVGAISSTSGFGGEYVVALLDDFGCNVATSTAETKGIELIKSAVPSRAADVESRFCSPQAEDAVVDGGSKGQWKCGCWSRSVALILQDLSGKKHTWITMFGLPSRYIS